MNEQSPEKMMTDVHNSLYFKSYQLSGCSLGFDIPFGSYNDYKNYMNFHKRFHLNNQIIDLKKKTTPVYLAHVFTCANLGLLTQVNLVIISLNDSSHHSILSSKC